MKPTILTQKNVCALLGLLMAITILWSASAEAKVDTFDAVTAKVVVNDSLGESSETMKNLEVDLKDIQIKALPTITFINKYGEVVAEFYGEKSEIEGKFKELLRNGTFMMSSGKHEFYLI
ncbi:hypothetical protein [Arthrospiribacter ruber]|uniref:Thioredoxin n=1 Tax=Arthrospiribacter ruber TaxID=2487934 RepID=A0A951IXX0_9BACT|nr:hypothetical protein [Arthrospiribacter ruber]MBW3469190.1 hypothetical protein [Arthrospiribacter ruber]